MKLTEEKLLSILSDTKVIKNNILSKCPWCNYKEFYVSLKENHPFQCWRKKRCGVSGNIYTLLEKLEIFDYQHINESIGWSLNVSDQITDIKMNDHIEIDLEEVKLPIGFKRIYTDQYLLDRGFSKKSFSKYIIGHTNLDQKLKNYVLVIISQQSKQVAYLSRYRANKKEIKLLEEKSKKKIIRYKNSISNFGQILGGYDEILDSTKTLILVEGFFDKEHVDFLLNLDLQEEIKCCFTFKCHISETQLKLIENKNIQNIILLYDPDVIEQIKSTALYLSNNFTTKIALIEYKNEEGNVKDPADLNLEELVTTLKVLYLPLDFYKSKVQILDL